MEALYRAKTMLNEGYTCVLCSQDKTYTATARGISPVLSFLDSGEDLSSFCAADKVVGKATAFLYTLLKIRAIYAPVMSRAALEILREHGIYAEYDVLTDAVLNHKKDGLCPMEAATLQLDSPTDALAAIRLTLQQLRKA